MDAPSRSSVMGHDDSTWRDRAASREAALDLFFPEQGHPDALAMAAAAKAVCATCPVVLACRDWAVAQPTEVGIWGGLTEAERRALRRQKQSVA